LKYCPTRDVRRRAGDSGIGQYHDRGVDPPTIEQPGTATANQAWLAPFVMVSLGRRAVPRDEAANYRSANTSAGAGKFFLVATPTLIATSLIGARDGHDVEADRAFAETLTTCAA
jgi:hypothetical protein